MSDHGNTRLKGTLVKLTSTKCHELLGTQTVGRIAYVNAEGQQIIPVNFIVISEKIYFRTRFDGFLSELWHGHEDVAFEVDQHEDDSHEGWNVTVRGSARRVTDRATINRALASPNLRPWAGGVRSTVIEIDPRSIDGRRVFETEAE